jgi:hypothetical protein
MKKVLILALLCLTAGSLSAQRVQVNADKELNHDFSQYKTFAWASQVDSKLDEGVYFLNDLVLKDRVRNAVQHELEGRGYKFSRQSPDLIINFRVFDKPTTIQGYSSYGVSYFGTMEMRDPEDVRTFELEPGSLIVNIIDTKTSRMVWRGFASGLMKDNVFNRDDAKIKQAVNLIFNEYGQRADGLTSR